MKRTHPQYVKVHILKFGSKADDCLETDVHSVNRDMDTIDRHEVF